MLQDKPLLFRLINIQERVRSMNNIIVCCGGQLGPWTKPLIESADIRIGSDRGALYLIQQGYILDYALGDFDSVTLEQLDLIKEKAKSFEMVDAIDKDDTDSMLALKKAISLNPNTITLIGALGSRYDHSMNNIQLLIQTAEANIPCVIEDERNRISIVDPNRKVSVNKSRFENISLIPLSTVVKGITISGFKYLLQDATFVQGKAYGISNVLIEEVGSVEVKEGYLLVIESND
ncbi:MAG: hypothetical protein RLZZ267_1389 [Bacillota bacterium]|jgi:thiamine pyrophosphokinase